MDTLLLLDVAQEMADSLIWKAENHDVDLSGLTIDNFNCYLDDAFDDGGEARCEHFTDLGIEYALGFGEFESSAFDDARWIAIEKAIELVQKAQV